MKYLIIIVVGFWSYVGYSLDPDFRHLTPLDGLNNGTINDIVQDSYGQMWFATWDGLMRYDGYFIKNYKPEIGNPYSITAKQSSLLFNDSRSNLWVVTKDGICRYNKLFDNFIPYRLEGIKSDQLSSTRIYEIAGVLIISFGSNLFYLQTDSVQHSTLFKKTEIRDKHNAPVNLTIRYLNIIQNKLWLTGSIADNDGNAINRIYLLKQNETDPGTLMINDEIEFQGMITSYVSGSENLVYIGTTNGLYLYEIREGRSSIIGQTQNLNIRDLLISSDNKLWIGTSKSGLGCLDLHNGNYNLYIHDPNRNNSILGNIIYSIYEDFSGNLWVGHGGEGLSILNLKQKPFESFRSDPNNRYSLSTNTILCFNESSTEIMIGTNYDGLVFMKFDPETGKVIFENVKMPDHFIIDDERSSKVWQIYRETDSLYWLGTNFGLIKVQRKNKNWTFRQVLTNEATGPIRQIFMDKNRNIWLGCYNGLFLIPFANRESMQYFQYPNVPEDTTSLSDRVVTAILLDKSGRFWIGTQSGGLNLLADPYETLDLSGKHKPQLRFIRYNAKYNSVKSLNNNEINILFDHPDGHLWIGTQGGGINIIDPATGEFRYLTLKDGLPGDDVFSLLPDGEGNLWISTNKGLSCYNLYDRHFNNYTPADGIQGNVFMVNAFFRSATGLLYFGGRNGFTRFDPGLISINHVPPRIIFNGLKIFNNEVQIGDTINGRVILPTALSELGTITLSHKENYFSLKFSLMHYHNPQENLVEYLLEGFDKTWNRVPASSEYITFNNLPHGSYTLKIKGANADYIWTEEIKELKINILPPWFKTWWARLLFITAFLLVLAGIMALILHRQSLKHLLKIEKIEIENLKELNEEKLRFFTNISHELRTPLSLTIAPIEDLISRRIIADSYIRKQLELAHRNARLLIRLINQIIDFRRLNAGKLNLDAEESDFSSLLKSVVNNFEAFKTEKRINLFLEISEEPFFLWFDIHKMEQILYNLLSNAYKFTRPGGTIKVKVSSVYSEIPANDQSAGFMELIVYNDGEEIPEDHIDKIFERFHKVNTKSEGSGIGLSLTKSLIELHKGSIKAESVSGRGVKFIAKFPLGEGHLLPEEKKSGTVREVIIQSQLPEKEYLSGNDDDLPADQELCILIVEDNSELRGFFRSHFENSYKVLEASDGLEGLKLAEHLIPDIIITDIVMPGMDGLQLCSQIKQNINTCHIPVIMLTAKDSLEFKVSGYDHGADAYVTKPFETRVLDQQVKTLIKNRELIHESYRKRNFIIDLSSRESSRDDLFIARVNALIEENITDAEFGVNNLAKLLSLSTTQVYRKVKALTGYSPVELIRVVRLVKASEILKNTGLSVKEVCFRTGFNSPSYFIKCFREHFNMTPNAFLSGTKVIE